jgi:hypothetical protein
MTRDFSPAIRRALSATCSSSLLRLYQTQAALGPEKKSAVRIRLLLNWLQSGKPLNATLASQALGTSTKTIYRDLHSLSKRAGYCLTFDFVSGGFALKPSTQETQ